MENKPDIQAQLDRLLASKELKNSARLQLLLSYLVTQTLSGKAQSLKGYTIGVDVFDRPPDFDTSNDAIVRVQAGKLRSKLEHYYLTEGVNDPIRIRLDKGSYIPVIEQIPQLGPTPTAANEPENAETTPYLKLAVSPFKSIGSDDEAYFGAGLAEEICTLLTRYSDISIVGKHALNSFSGSKDNLQRLLRDYGVDYILSGRFAKAGDHLRLNIQLEDVNSDTTVWAETFEPTFSSNTLFKTQDEIAEKVLARIALPYGAINRVHTRTALRKPPHDLTHYEWVLRAYDYVDNPSSEKHQHVRQGLEKTVHENPDYADAWIMLAWVYGDEYRMSYNTHNERAPLDLALDASTRATSLQPMNSKAFHQLAVVHYCRKELGKFEHAAHIALDLNPNDSYALADLGTCYFLSGEPERGLMWIEKAIELNPFHPDWYHIAPFLNAFRKKKFDDALVIGLKFRTSKLYLFHLLLTLNYIELGRVAEAEVALKDLLCVFPEFPRHFQEELDKNILDPTLVDTLVSSWRKVASQFSLH